MNQGNDMLPESLRQEDLRTDFMKQKAMLKQGQKLNACKVRGFGCEDEELDQNGYCRHLVGWTTPGDHSRYHPRVRRNQTQEKGTMAFEFVQGSVNNDADLPIQEGDKLVLISEAGSARVYRDVDEVEEPAPIKKNKKAAAEE